VAGRRGVTVVGAGDHGPRDLDARELVGRGHKPHDRLDLDAKKDLAVTQHSIARLGVEGPNTSSPATDRRNSSVVLVGSPCHALTTIFSKPALGRLGAPRSDATPTIGQGRIV
jgi:hypothetical protein